MELPARSLQNSRLMKQDDIVDEDPMGSMGNLMDVMLVFACALIVALISHYNIDLTSADPTITNYETLEGELTEANLDGEAGDSSYVALGTVYQDVETGDLYVVKPEEG